MPYLRLVPSGGITLQTLASYIQAGAIGVAVGSTLVKETIISRHNWQDLRTHARRFLDAVSRARAS